MSDHSLFRPVNYHVGKLLDDIAMGEIGLPELQRPFVWKKTKIRDLFDSMYRGYPVGYLLLWSNDEPTKTRAIGTDGKQRVPRLLVIDGQQRLTSLFAVVHGQEVITAEFERVRIEIGFNPLEERFEVADAAIRRDPLWIANISDLWRRDMDIFEFADQFLERVSLHNGVDDAGRKRIRRSIQRLHSITSFPVTALELSGSLDEEKVAEVFVRINSKAQRLNQADFILTLMSVHWEEGRRQLEAFCAATRQIPDKRAAASAYNPFVKADPDDMIRVAVGLGFRRARLRYAYLILRGKDLETEEFIPELREKQFGVLQAAQEKVLNLTHWHDFFKALLKAGVRSDQMITSKTAVIYSYCLYLIGRCDIGMDERALREVIARWYFFASLTGRYTDSPESAMETDLANLRGVTDAAVFIQRLSSVMETELTEDFWSITLPAALATSSARSPGLFSYFAALNLLDARVLFSDLRVSDLTDPHQKHRRKPLERHHLFAKAYLKRQGVTDRREVNQIANMALVEWPDNLAISDRAPVDYVPEAMRCYSPAEAERICFWHGLPDKWEQMDYPAFLEARRKALAAVVRAGFDQIRDRKPSEASLSHP